MSNTSNGSPSVPQISPQQKEALAARAEQVNASQRSKVQQFVDSHQPVLAAESNAVYVGGGEVEFAVFVAYGILTIDSLFVGTPSGTLSFSGNDWSFGLGAWEAYGVASFVLPPNQLTGHGSVTVVAGGVEEGAFTLMVYDGNGVYYGNITGIAEGAGIAGGNIGGAFTWSGS